jgi:hypothetical protein
MASTLTRLAFPFAPAMLLALTGCGGNGSEQFAPPCPVPSIPRDFGDLHRFRGNGRDLTDSVLEGRITGLDGSCTRGGAGITVATISVGIDLTRGPAASGRSADLSYFVAVSEGEQIIDKQVYTLHAEFPANTDRLRLAGDQVELRLPVTPEKTAAAYRVSVGFQLSPAELDVNRNRPR